MGFLAVGEPQNVQLATLNNWNFGEYFLRLLPISLFVLVSGLITLVVVEMFELFGYGTKLPESVRQVLIKHTSNLFLDDVLHIF